MSAGKPEVSELQGRNSSLRSRCNLETQIQRTLLFLTSGELRQRIQPVPRDGPAQKKRDQGQARARETTSEQGEETRRTGKDQSEVFSSEGSILHQPLWVLLVK